jgi:hypothetical protein
MTRGGPGTGGELPGSTSADLTVGGLWRWLLDDAAGSPDAAAGLLAWAPDVQALTSVVLERAQAFRFVVSPPAGQAWPPPSDEPFSTLVGAAARAWCAAMDGGPEQSPPEVVRRLWGVVLDHLQTPIRELAEGRPWALCEAVLTLHAIADEASAGLLRTRPVDGPGTVFRARCGELLARRGSVSRQPADRVTVIPKGRTTPVGITHRSLSRYLATAWDGVEVRWNAVPMRRGGGPVGDRRANVLLLPWPLQVRESDFAPVPGTVRRPEREPFGFFSYRPREPLDLDLVDRLLDAALAQVDRVDVVVLPEGCLDEREVAPFEALLQHRRVPMLVSGLRSEPIARGEQPGNGVHLGLWLGQHWWHDRQHKHHRWFLDAGQIAAYGIGGALPPDVRWWEAMAIPRRSVHFLDLGGGVTVAAVVCEDLARLDGVAELIRAVAPTLVLTLLLDGPQLATRWTARYASVLADDPGSAVLTLTALGMAVRSRPRGLAPSRAVAMWKDPIRGLQEIPCEVGSQGVLLELQLDRVPRYAADGRDPVDDVADLRLAGVHQVAAEPRAAPAAPVWAPPSPAEPALDQVELSVLAAWAGAAAQALVARRPVEGVLAQAARGAAWRAAAGIPEPSERLQAAITMLGRAAAAASSQADPGQPGPPSVPAMQRAVAAAADAADPVGLLACSVLAATLDRFATHALPTPRPAQPATPTPAARGAAELRA